MIVVTGAAGFAAMNLSPAIEYVQMPVAFRGKYQHFTQAEMARMRNAGYNRPFTSLEDGVRAYFTTYLDRMQIA